MREATVTMTLPVEPAAESALLVHRGENLVCGTCGCGAAFFPGWQVSVLHYAS